MKIDLDYLQLLLVTAIESDRSFITINDWKKKDIKFDGFNKPLDEKFIFHLRILMDNGLIQSIKTEGKPVTLESLGVMVLQNASHIITNEIPIRLTQKGHDFANVLENSEVLNKLKTNFKNMTFDMIFDTGKKIVSAIANKKLEDLGLS